MERKRAKSGEARAWVIAHVDYEGDDCLYWPFYCGTDGYGEVGWDGRKQPVHRVINILKNGLPTEDKTESAHTCGRGMQGCVNPNHLYWATSKEQAEDRRRHGTMWMPKGEAHPHAKLTEGKVRAIKEFYHTCSPRTIADLFDIHRSTVHGIVSGRTWRHL